MDLRFVGSKLGQDSAKPQRLLTERRAQPVVTCSRRVSFIEDQIDDFEDRRDPLRHFGAAWDFEGHLSFGEGALGTDNSLSNCWFRNEEAARDLFCGQSSEQPER